MERGYAPWKRKLLGNSNNGGAVNFEDGTIHGPSIKRDALTGLPTSEGAA
ncbi:hypothetical protein ABZV93_28370 [Actinopolymorpha sp. NPDC004070]